MGFRRSSVRIAPPRPLFGAREKPFRPQPEGLSPWLHHGSAPQSPHGQLAAGTAPPPRLSSVPPEAPAHPAGQLERLCRGPVRCPAGRPASLIACRPGVLGTPVGSRHGGRCGPLGHRPKHGLCGSIHTGRTRPRCRSDPVGQPPRIANRVERRPYMLPILKRAATRPRGPGRSPAEKLRLHPSGSDAPAPRPSLRFHDPTSETGRPALGLRAAGPHGSIDDRRTVGE